MNIHTNMMEIDQVIVSSDGTLADAPNRLVSRSSGVDDATIEFLCRWCPDRNGIAYGQSTSINLVQLDQDLFGLSRSVIGGLECHRDRGRQVMTHIVVFGREQIQGYEYNPVKLARVLLSMGSLILRTNPSAEMPMLNVPRTAFGRASVAQDSGQTAGHDRLYHAIEVHGSAVVFGIDDPLEYLDGLLMAAEPAKRLEVGFATDLRVVDDRPIPLQFFRESNPVLIKDLARRQHRTILLEPEPVTGT